MLVSGPKTGCLVMASSGKVVAMRCKPHIPHRKDVALVAYKTSPCLKTPEAHYIKEKLVSTHSVTLTEQVQLI